MPIILFGLNELIASANSESWQVLDTPTATINTSRIYARCSYTRANTHMLRTDLLSSSLWSIGSANPTFEHSKVLGSMVSQDNYYAN